MILEPIIYYHVPQIVPVIDNNGRWLQGPIYLAITQLLS